jgi:hypothetical protein
MVDESKENLLAAQAPAPHLQPNHAKGSAAATEQAAEINIDDFMKWTCA